MINTVKIQGIFYKMPDDKQKYRSVVNHIDMVQKGLKDFVKLVELDTDEEIKLNKMHLQDGDIIFKLW